VVLGLVCLALAIGLASQFWQRPRYNLLLITLDTTRADHIGCYGNAQALTPVLDSLAREGVLFEQAYAPVAMTLPSHASLFTGLYPPEHGLHTNGRGRLPTQLPTLAESLTKQGYQTAGFVASFILHSKFGLNRGFQTYDDDMAGGEVFGHEAHLVRNGKQMVDAALSWLQLRSQKPFFCWVHLYDPHEPYDAHEELFGDRFAESPYDGDISFTDQQVGRLIEYLKVNKLDERTIVVVVGDHGEGLGDHEEREHGFTVYNSTIHVPLIVAGPQCRAGHRVPSPVSLVDLLPTVLDYLKVTPPKPISGQSVVAALGGTAIEPHLCYSEAETAFIAYGWSPQQSLTTESWKYIKTTREELYDLRGDPHELRNLAESQPEQMAEMQGLLAGVTERMNACPETDSQLSESDRRKLESLGYLSGGSIDPALANAPLPDVKDMIGPYNAELDARDLLEAGKFVEAEVQLRDIVQNAPNFMIARTSLGRALQKQNRNDEAVAVYEEVLKLQPDSAEAHFDLGNIRAARNELDAAIEHYTAVLQTDRLTSVAHVNLAEVYAFKGEPELARLHYEEALEEFPDSASGHFNYGIFLAKQGILDESLTHLERAVQLLPDNPQMRYQLGLVLLSMGNVEAAQTQLKETLRLAPEHPGAQAQLQQIRDGLSSPMP